jgi:hypothetical protein
VKWNLPEGVSAEPVDGERNGTASVPYTTSSLKPGQTADVLFRLTISGNAAAGLHVASVQLGYPGPQRKEVWTDPSPLSLTVGPVLLDDNSFPAFGEFVVYAPRYTFRLSKLYGVSRFLRDDAGRPRYEATFWDRRTAADRGQIAPQSLPMLYIDNEPVLAWGRPVEFMWPTRSPASVTVGTQKGRLHWTFEDDRIRVEPVSLWTSEKPHEIAFPANWTAWGGASEWVHILTVDEAGQEKPLEKAPSEPEAVRFVAAALRVPGYDERVCLAVDRPQTAHFKGAELRFTVGPGEPFWFGLCRPEAFAEWRRKEDQK